MKKRKKGKLLIIILIVGILAGIALIVFYPVLQMAPTETGYISDTGVFAVGNSGGTVYLIKTESGYIMIDAGSEPGEIETVLSGQGIAAGEVKWTFLTHSDSDHVASLPLFPDAEIYMSEDEIDLVNGTKKRNAFSYNRLPVSIDGILLVRDMQELEIGGVKVECLKTPGHTPGSMSYLVDGKYLFTGDACKIYEGKYGIHPFTMDKGRAGKTIEALKSMPGNDEYHVFTAHYGYHKS